MDKFTPQIVAYDSYVANGAYEKRFQAKSLRILIVTTTIKRMEGLQKATQRVSGATYYWFTTFDKVNVESVLSSPIWQKLGNDELVPLITRR